MKKLLATLVTLVMIVSSLAVLTSCGAKDGLTPSIGENGNWFIGETDTGVPATGPKGEKGDTGATGPKGDEGNRGVSGAAGKDAVAPSFRYNIVDECFEYSYDGETWTAVPEVAPDVDEPETPAAPAIDPNMLDDTLTEYAYPMETVLPAEGGITYYLKEVKGLSGDEYKADPDCHMYVVSDEYSDYLVAFINLEGTVFTGAKFTGNEANYMGWFWLEEMPAVGEAINYAGTMQGIHETSRGVGSQTGKVSMQEGSKILAVVYSRVNPLTEAVENVLPGGILFVK